MEIRLRQQKKRKHAGEEANDKRSSSVFDDLTALPAGEVEAMYERTVERLARSEETLFASTCEKTPLGDDQIRREQAQFAAGVEDDAEDELIQLAVEQKQAFDAALSHRDELVKRLVVPRHRVANTLADFYTKLTNVDGHSLAQEMEMFARFFELQTMLVIYDEEQDKLAELNDRGRTCLKPSSR